MSKVQSEYEVESLFIEKLNSIGYGYIELRDYNAVLKNFREQFCRLNEEKLMEAKGSRELSDAEFDRVIVRLTDKTVYESAKILRDKWVLTLDNGKTVYVEFFSNVVDRNAYQVSHQITMDPKHKDDVEYKNRYDVTILINGLPLVQIELKRPGIELNEAVNQINRYRDFSFKGLFRYIQIFVVSNSVQTKYFANANEKQKDGTYNPILKSLVFYWTDKNNERINKLSDFTSDFLSRYSVTEMIDKYMVIKQTEPVIMVMRPYQIYAVKLALSRVLISHMNGFCFHCTGSGKTLTSFKLATLLRDDKQIDRVFFLIDRKDLDDQTVDEYNSFEKDCVDETDNTYHLVKQIEDSSKTMIVTTIQKMANALKADRYKKIMDLLRDKRCVFIIDECHRSQFGKMHGEIKRHFNNANYIGFTGTPIFSDNKGADSRTTADIFNAGKEDPCIHKYMIKEAIADGNVLRFSVEYMRSIFAKNIANPDIDPDRLDDPEYCKLNQIDISDLYHDDGRIEAVSKDILAHLEQHTHPVGKDEYTAIFAVDSISTLLKYYNCMKENNSKKYRIAAIFTYQQNEDMEEGADEHSSEALRKCMKDYNGMFGTSYDLDSFDGYRKDISKRLKEKDLPKVDLLLVVDMFLTGFDSKKTNTLILDKNLIWHSLVQAYSRTNRVDKVTKQFGQIITYRNIKREQDAALKLFSGSGDPNEYLLENYNVYLARYSTNVAALRTICETADDAGHLVSEDDKRNYVLAFRLLSQTLATLKTFSNFDWKDLDPFMDEQEYAEYKSWYLTFYDEQKKQREDGKTHELIDVDFNIELIRTDKINVVYILNLLKDINRKDPEKMRQSVDLILREIERSDNEKLRYKREIMKAFVQTRFFDLSPDEDIVKAYDQFENDVMTKETDNFSKENGLDSEMMDHLLSEYFIDDSFVSEETIRTSLSDMHLGILKMTVLAETILKFLRDMKDKFTAEGM